MKYTDLSDKERYEVIRLGVQNGMTNLNDIEKAYNEYAEGGSLKEDDYYNNVVLQKDDEQKQQIKEQLEERRTYADGGKINEIQSLFKSNPIEAKKMWDSLSDDDKKAYGIKGGFWNVVNDISHKFGDGSNIYGYSENDDALTLYKDIDDIYVTPNGNYYEGEEFDKRKQEDIMNDISNNPALLFNPDYNKWYNHYRNLSKKEGWDFDSEMSEIFNRLPFEEQEWVMQNNPSAFNLLPQDVKSDYITRTKGMRPGTFQRLVDDAGDRFLEKSVNNAVAASSLIPLANVSKAVKGIDTLYKTKAGDLAVKGFKKYVVPPLTAYWGVEGAKDLVVNDPFGKAVDEVKNKDYYGAAADAIHGALDASMILPAAGFFGKAGKGIYDSSSKAVQSIKDKVNKPNIQFIRGMNTVPEIKPDGTFSLSPEENLFTNFTSDLPMIPHESYKNAPTNTLFFDQSSIRGVRPISIEPMDNIALNSEIKLKPKQVRFVSPNPEQMEIAKQRGFIVDEWPKELKDLYSQLENSKQLIPAKKSGTIILNPEHYEYNNELQKEFKDKYNNYLKSFYRRPTYKDYQSLEKQTKLQSKVKEDKNIKSVIDYLKKVKNEDIIPSDEELIRVLGENMEYQIPNNELTISMKHIPDFENVVYDIAPSVEYDLTKSFGIPAHPKIKDGKIYSSKKSSDVSYEDAIKKIEDYLKDKGTFKYGGNIYETKDLH